MKQKLPRLLAGMVMLTSVTTFAAVTNTVLIGSYFFNPTNLAINVGDTVRWTNTTAATVAHDSTRTNTPFTWASGSLNSSVRTYQLTFSNAGFFPYFCNTHVNANLPANRHPEQTGTVSVVSINLSPSVSLTNPVNNARLLAPANILLQASATDDGSVTNVQFFSGGTLLGSNTSAPYVFTFNNAAAGNYSFTARAQDNTGLAATSAVVNVFVLTNATLTSPTMLPNGQFQLTIQGIAGQTYATETSSNLANWSAIITNVAPANTFNITDAISTNVLQRFYRTRQDL
ncbi:MAG: Ig-like domain-containing protein [Verrucomicrobiota bacterium]